LHELDIQNSDSCTISICIPAYNNLDSLSVALESICLQNYPNLEILVSDDHSPNSVKPVFDQWASRYPHFLWRYHYQEKNLGVAQNQAWLLRNATGHLMTFFQHDDYLIDSEFYVKVANYYKVNNSIKVYVGNAVLQSPLSDEPMNKRVFPLDSKNQDFKIYKPLKFLKFLAPTIYGTMIPISWSSLVFEIRSAIEVGAFSNLYLTDASRSIELNTFADEEAGVFLSLLNDKFAVGFSKKSVSYRSILDTSFSLPQNNPGALLVHPNNIEVFNLLRASGCVENTYTKFKLRARAVSIGLNTNNRAVRRFLGNNFGNQTLIFLCLVSGKLILPMATPALKFKVRALRFAFLARCRPRYLLKKTVVRIFRR
jgi:glycosyltransferase involved in cell wall biosynthesis